MPRLLLRLLPFASAVALLAGEAQAAGFAIREQSATAQGNAFAGATAGAEDPSYMFFNPAALAYQEGTQAVVLQNVVLPTIRLKDSQGSTVTGDTIPGRPDDDDVGKDALIPAFYGSWELDPAWHLGLAVTVPFGLATDYSDGWTGRYHALYSSVKTININPAVAWRPLPWLSIGGGVQVQYLDAELSSAIDFGTIGAVAGVPGSVPGQQDGRVQVRGDDLAYGWNAGAIVETPVEGLRLGVAYRSKVEHRLTGDADFTTDDAGIGSALANATGRFRDSGVSADLTTPAMLSFGFQQTLNERWSVQGELAWTQWSSFDQLVIRFDNDAESPSVTEERWNDVWFAALGATWRPDPNLALRAGVAYDQSPTTDRHRSPRIADGDRYWLSVGGSWQVKEWLSLDASWAHVFMDDTKVSQDTNGEGNTFRGNLDANYETHIDLVALSARIRF
ncbi:OmpP1/FadL family transporter [Marinimicrococcus flavescens]|uniref:Outer membrane protein transport protein n=1 Tax=Marinimicrococcus flavescens TaxID=3031815 RepID=A0AAP3XQI0_9PROT|nr:outer membrane protein transport protein [Marinimicrococcus flavescens]